MDSCLSREVCVEGGQQNNSSSSSSRHSTTGEYRIRGGFRRQKSGREFLILSKPVYPVYCVPLKRLLLIFWSTTWLICRCALRAKIHFSLGWRLRCAWLCTLLQRNIFD
ncbi:unnamed protein product [Pylaiella littoralis]